MLSSRPFDSDWTYVTFSKLGNDFGGQDVHDPRYSVGLLLSNNLAQFGKSLYASLSCGLSSSRS